VNSVISVFATLFFRFLIDSGGRDGLLLFFVLPVYLTLLLTVGAADQIVGGESDKTIFAD